LFWKCWSENDSEGLSTAPPGWNQNNIRNSHMSGEEISRKSPGSLYLLADDGEHFKLTKTLDLDLYVTTDQKNGLSKIHQPAAVKSEDAHSHSHKTWAELPRYSSSSQPPGNKWGQASSVAERSLSGNVECGVMRRWMDGMDREPSGRSARGLDALQ
jgi:hypothetical protein